MKTVFIFLFTYFICLSSTFSQVVYIPDLDFKADLIAAPNYADINDDGEIEVSEAVQLEEIRISASNLSSIEGIKSFTNLSKLTVRNSRLTKVDLSGMQNLNAVDVNLNSVDTIILSDLPVLEHLNVRTNQIQRLDLSAVPSLKILFCDFNNISDLRLDGLVHLETIQADQNSMPRIDLSDCMNLVQLNIQDNKISEIDLSNSLLLENIHVGKNLLSSLDISAQANLVSLTCHDNDLSELDLSQNLKLVELFCYENSLTDLDLSENKLLEHLWCSSNQLSELDLSKNLFIRELNCSFNKLSSLNISQNTALTSLRCHRNELEMLMVNHMIHLEYLDCEYNRLSFLDVSDNKKIEFLECGNNDLVYILAKTGNDFEFRFEDNPFLTYICVGKSELSFVNDVIEDYGLSGIHVNSYCTFEPAQEFKRIKGLILYDGNGDGCQSDELFFLDSKLTLDNPAINNRTYSSKPDGSYALPILRGRNEISLSFENDELFSIDPDVISIDFDDASEITQQDFCITPLEPFSDLEVIVHPQSNAIPGFVVEYVIIFKNKGTEVVSGDIKLVTPHEYLTFQDARPLPEMAGPILYEWPFEDLQPFESRKIDISFELNKPTDSPPLNAGNLLNYKVEVSPSGNDSNPSDNVMCLDQLVINSFDPNDKTCLQGESILIDQVGEYVHYKIRFENTGTAEAVNVIVTDEIDLRKLELETIQVIDASHEVQTRVERNGLVEFIFENIFLPFNDEDNDGYIIFKVKTKNNLEVGDIFENEANIYFDFNLPILTNKTNTVVDMLSANLETAEIELDLVVFPNPSSGQIYISSSQPFLQGRITDSRGYLVSTFHSDRLHTKRLINVSSLSAGLYVANILTNGQWVNKSFIVN